MGSKSSSASSQTTNNTSTTFGIQGANNGLVINGSGNTVTDGGAFDIVGRIVDIFPNLFGQGVSMVGDGFNAVTDVAMMGERQTEQAFNTATNLYGQSVDLQRDMVRENGNVLDSAFALGNELFRGGADLLASITGNQDAANNRAFNAVSDVALMGERQNQNFLNAAVDLFGETNSAQQDMIRVGANALTEFGDLQARGFETYTNATRDNLSDSLKFADGAVAINAAVSQASMDNSKSLATTVADALAKANDNNTFLAGTAMTNSADLAESLTKTALDAGNQANKDATGQLQRGFDSMMGFAEQFSRSDGAALAESNNKTMLYMLGGTALVAGAVMFMGRK
ncbi:hypothetical protein [Shewanella baltica]|uniref:hypothetical protein n=1 Tax=Shewanella baltica TaxID=62322 RepID=UPI00217D734D|nr:hypothetical protein [Shewanella baltica]MCS6211267.1 hypothetical protein [Shewanella baltica]